MMLNTTENQGKGGELSAMASEEKTPATERIQAIVPADLARWIRQYATEKDATVSQVIRWLLTEARKLHKGGDGG